MRVRIVEKQIFATGSEKLDDLLLDAWQAAGQRIAGNKELKSLLQSFGATLDNYRTTAMGAIAAEVPDAAVAAVTESVEKNFPDLMVVKTQPVRSL